MRVTKYKRITIIKTSRPRQPDINENLQWLGTSLGLFNLRDKDKSCFRIFIELLKAAKKGVGLSSDEIAVKLGLSRGTVIHHINKLMEAGIVVADKNKYMLRVDNLEVLIDEIKRDVENTVSDLKDVAKKIDDVLDL